MPDRAQIAYLVRESFSGFHRRKLTTGVTVLIMASALLILALFTMVALNLATLLEDAHGGIDLRVFLDDGLPREELPELQARLMAIDGVRTALYISKEQALADFREDFADESELIATLEENPLPASFHLTLRPDARNAVQVRAIAAQVDAWGEVADVVFSQGWVEVLERWAKIFRWASLIVGLTVFLSAVFVISNTVKLTVASSARVIEIMKLVGATDGFIRTPFLCEGMLEGLCGGLLAMGLLCGAYSLLAPRIEGLLFFTPWQIAGFVIFCVALGLVGSHAAMRKYLQL